jgi:hypothetical protein
MTANRYDTDHTTAVRLSRIHRCTCGAWTYSRTQPTICVHMTPKQAKEAS